MASPQIFEDLSSVFSILLQKKSEHTFLYYPLFQDYLNLLTLVAKQKRKQRRAKRKKEARDNLTKEEILQDDRFFCIAGYTSGGAPYGVTWEEKDLKPWEDLEENE